MSEQLSPHSSKGRDPSHQQSRERPASLPDGPVGDEGGALGDLLYLWRAVRENAWIVGALFLLGAGAALAYSLLIPPTYESYSAVLVNTKEAPTSSSRPSDLVEETLSLQQSNRTIGNELERLRQSIPLAKKVVVRVGPDTLIAEAEVEDPPTRTELAQYLLEERVRFEQAGEEVDLIRITATAPQQRRAARIANVYAEEYRQHSRKVSQSGARASREFLRSQVKKRKQELEETERKLRQFMEENEAVALDTKSESAVEQIATLDAKLQSARAELKSERIALKELRTRIGEIEPNVLQRVRSSAGEEIDALQKKIARLEAEASDYYAQNPGLRGNEVQNPKLASLNQRIAEARSRVDSLSKQLVREVEAAGGFSGTGSGAGEGSARGMVYLSELKRRALRRRVRVRSLETRVQALKEQVAQYEGQLGALPGRSVRLAQLRRSQRAAEQMYLSLQQKLQEASVAEESQIGYVDVVRPALVPGAPIAPITKLNVLLGALLGLALGTGLALVRHVTDRQLRTPSDLHALGFETLGLIPEHRADGGEHVLVGRRADRPGLLPDARSDGDPVEAQQAEEQGGEHEESSVPTFTTETEAFRHLRTNLQFGQSPSDPRVVAVTSPRMGEGKTSVAIGLASIMAQAGRRTLLIDADLRRPAGHRYLNVSRTDGLTDLLERGGPPESWEAFRLGSESKRDSRESDTRERDGMHTDTHNAVYFLPAGYASTNAAELLETLAMQTLVDRARRDFDMVILDTSPLLTVADPLLAATYCDASILVAAAGETTREALVQARGRIESIRSAGPLAGVVLNRVDADNGELADYGYDYGYGHEDSSNADSEDIGRGDAPT